MAMSGHDSLRDLKKSTRIGLEAALAIHRDVKGGPRWYVGIASDPRRRLRRHKVDLDDKKSYRVRKFEDAEIARRVMENLHSLRYKGDGGEGDARSRYLYVYRITRDTYQEC